MKKSLLDRVQTSWLRSDSLVAIHSTIETLDVDEWNRLAGDSAFASHGWLRTCERCWLAQVEPVYFTFTEADCLLGSAVCYVAESSPDAETLDDMLLGRLRRKAARLGVSFLPALVCSPASGYGWHIGLDSGLREAERSRVRLELIEAMEAEADRRGLLLSFVQTLDREADLRALLERRGYLTSWNVPIAVMDVPWRSMDEYWEHLPAKRRREARRERRRNRESGTQVTVGSSDPAEDERCRELLDAKARQYGASGMAYGPTFLAELRANLNSRAPCLTARRDGAVSGANLVFGQGDALTAFAVGVDPKLGGDDFTYFELVYYSLIEHAITTGVRRIDFGRGMLDVKVRRGCRLENASIHTRVFGLPRVLYKAWYKVASAWNRRKPAG